MPAFGERSGKAGNKNGQFLKKVLPKAFDFQDFSLLKNDYNGMLAGVGGAVRVLEPGNEYTGISRGIDERGELLVERQDGELKSVYAGEVSVRGVYGYV